MKKRLSILLFIILAVFLFTACASAGSSAYNDTAMWAAPQAPQAMPAPEAELYGFDGEMALMADMDDSRSYSMAGGGGDAAGYTHGSSGSSNIVPVAEPGEEPADENLAEKIIYSVHASIETMQFDDTIKKVDQLLATYNAFIENSSVSGINYESRHYGWNEYRYAHFTLRVPVNQLSAMVENLGTLGNITHRSNDAINITSQFFDTQSRLNSLRIQEERLLDMLSNAEDVPDLIMIEQRLSDIRYQIEALTTTLTGWQRQVDFSTVSLYIREVEEFTEQPQLNVSYWEQIEDGFFATIRSVGQFFMDLFKWLAISAPVIVIYAVIIIIILLIIRQKIRSVRKKRAAQNEILFETQTPAVTQEPNAAQETGNETEEPKEAQ